MPLLKIDSIIVRNRLRKINSDKVQALMTSISELGMLAPILVSGNRLTAGAHRLEACRRLGHTDINVSFYGDANDPDSLQLIEIDENLFRNELSPAEQKEHIALRVKIIGRRKAKEIQPEKEDAYKKKYDISRPLSDKAYQKVVGKAEKAGTAEAIKDVASVLGTNTTNISAAIRDHNAVTNAGLDQNQLEDLNDTQYKRVAKVAKTQGAEAAEAELLEQLTKPKGKSTLSHDNGEKLKQDIGVLISARSIIRGWEKNRSDLVGAYCQGADEAISELIAVIKSDEDKPQ